MNWRKSVGISRIIFIKLYGFTFVSTVFITRNISLGEGIKWLKLSAIFCTDETISLKELNDKFKLNIFCTKWFKGSGITVKNKQIIIPKKRKNNIDYVEGLGIQAAAIASIKGHPFTKELLEYYHTHSFIKIDGSFNQVPAPLIYAKLLESRGFRYEDRYQYLPDEIKIYDSSVFAGFQTCTFKSVVIHVCAGSWAAKKNKKMECIKKNLLIRKLYNTIIGSNWKNLCWILQLPDWWIPWNLNEVL